MTRRLIFLRVVLRGSEQLRLSGQFMCETFTAFKVRSDAELKKGRLRFGVVDADRIHIQADGNRWGGDGEGPS